MQAGTWSGISVSLNVDLWCQINVSITQSPNCIVDRRHQRLFVFHCD